MSIPETLDRLITGDELLKMGDVGRCELVNGEIIRMSPAGWRHGQIAHRIGRLVGNYAEEHGLGEVAAAETGFYTRKNPDTLRAPDAMFVSTERAAQITDPVKYLDVVPELVVEVLSPENTWTEMETKIDEYIQAGVALVWIVDPDTCAITVCRAEGERTRLGRDDALEGEDVLPGFSVPVSRVFE